MLQRSLNRLGAYMCAGNEDSNRLCAGKSLPWQFQAGIVARITAGSAVTPERVESERLSGRRWCQELKNPDPVSGRVLQLFVVCSTPMPERYAISVAR